MEDRHIVIFLVISKIAFDGVGFHYEIKLYEFIEDGAVLTNRLMSYSLGPPTSEAPHGPTIRV